MQPKYQAESLVARLRRYRLFIVPGLLVAVVAAGATVYKVHLLPPSLERDSAVFATSSTQVLVDWGDSALAEPDRDVGQLAERAGVYARLAASPAVVGLIGRKSGIPAGAIDARGPYNPRAERLIREPSAERRASQLHAEREVYRVRFDAEQNTGVPIVEIFSQAPTVAESNRLSDGAAKALAAYVKQFELTPHPGLSRLEGTRPNRPPGLTLRELGRARGGVVNPNADLQIAILAFAAALIGYWLLVLGGFSLMRFLRSPSERPPPPRHSSARRPLGVARARPGLTENRR